VIQRAIGFWLKFRIQINHSLRPRTVCILGVIFESQLSMMSHIS